MRCAFKCICVLRGIAIGVYMSSMAPLSLALKAAEHRGCSASVV